MQLGPQIPHLAVQADALRILGMLGLLTYTSPGSAASEPQLHFLLHLSPKNN